MLWFILYPFTKLRLMIKDWVQSIFKFLLRYDTFRREVIYPKLGMKYDSSIKRTLERPILHSEIDGGRYHFPVFANQSRIDDLRTSRLREDDVLVATYPKSGTHLCGYIVKLLAEKRSKIMQDPMVLPFYEMMQQSTLDSVPASTQRILKTHLPLPLIPPCVDFSVKNKIIFCLRDPKDACVSYYKFTLGLEILTGPVYETFNEWVELWLSGCVDYGDWFDFVLPYWDQRHQDNCLIVTYEDILQNPAHVIMEIGEFLGYSVAEEEIEEVKEKIKFKNMKQEIEKGEKMSAGPTLMRSGKTGEGSNAFSERHHRLFDRMFRERVQGTGFNVYNYSK